MKKSNIAFPPCKTHILLTWYFKQFVMYCIRFSARKLGARTYEAEEMSDGRNRYSVLCP